MSVCTINFCRFVENVCQVLKDISDANPYRISNCKNGEDFEACVVDAVHITLEKENIAATVHYTQVGMRFLIL